jgi:hypothetical protein
VRRRTQQETGACIVLTSSCLSTAVQAVEAIAGACSVQVRKFRLNELLVGKVGDTCIDPVTQERIYDPMEFIFRAPAGQKTVTLIVDETSVVGGHNEEPLRKTPGSQQLLRRLGRFDQVCFPVCREFKARPVPTEVDLVVHLGFPPEEAQISRWESALRELPFEYFPISHAGGANWHDPTADWLSELEPILQQIRKAHENR